MKSVLVATSFVESSTTAMASLTKGQLTMVDENGVKPDKTKGSKFIQFVVGLENGIKRGLMLSLKDLKKTLTAYEAPTSKVYKFTELVAQRTMVNQGTDAEFVISIKPLNSFGGYPLEVYNASVTMLGVEETSDELLARLNTELKKVIAKINERFGANTITVTELTSGAVTFTGKAGFEFYVNCDGILKGTKVEEGGKIGCGTYEQIATMEKEAEVASQGYNPNFEHTEKVYGDIFLADKSKTYDQIVITSAAPHTHPFHIQSEGLDVTQIIAVVAGTVDTTIDTAINSLLA